ncbi:MAG: sugar ABC transporter permease [Spirochaetales bacterium]|nr:sugar ABC transporter permease [Spirochaetales bacterium]
MDHYKSRKWIVVFLLPLVIMFFLFFILPLGFVFIVSLTKWGGFGKMEFVFLDNYRYLFQNGTFRIAIRNNFIWAFSLGFVQITLATVVAMILSRKPLMWKFLRTIYFLPNVISQVAIAMMWIAIYNAEYGALNRLLELAGLSRFATNWLGTIETALPAVILQQVLYIGYFMIIILAGRMTVPDSLYEAADLDGASVLQQELYITIPMLKDILITSMTLAMAFGLRHFESTFLMTAGGPANSTQVMGIMLYNNLHSLTYGRANAIGSILIILGFFVIVLIRRVFGSSSFTTEIRQ